MQCRQTNTITLPQPAMDWTCGLAVRGNFTCMGGAVALPTHRHRCAPCLGYWHCVLACKAFWIQKKHS